MESTLSTGDIIYVRTVGGKPEFYDIVVLYIPNDFSNPDMSECPLNNDYNAESFAKCLPFFGTMVNPQPISDKWTCLVKRVIGLPGDTLEYKSEFSEQTRCYMINLYRNGELLDEGFVIYDSAYRYLGNIPSGANTLNARAAFTLAEDEYYVLGDNRRVSYDSSDFGAVKKDWILGTVTLMRVDGELTNNMDRVKTE